MIIFYLFMAAIVGIFIACALSVLFESHVACELDTFEELAIIEDKLCPYCGRHPRLGMDNYPICTCPDFLEVNDLSQCIIHNLIFDGRTCPKCSGTNLWRT